MMTHQDCIIDSYAMGWHSSKVLMLVEASQMLTYRCITNRRTVKAIREFRCLINSGYRRSSALNLVSNKHNLSERERHLLQRAVFSRREVAERVKRKITSWRKKLEELSLFVDFYNVLITLETALRGGEIVLCDDTFYRDLSLIGGKRYAPSSETEAILREMRDILDERFRKVTYFLDSKVSKSGEMRALLSRLGMRGKLINNVDHELMRLGTKKTVIGSSDRSIIERVQMTVDIPALVISSGVVPHKVEVLVLPY